MRILVTGGAGFIGSRLVEALLERGHQVTVLDSLDPYYDPALKRRNLEPLLPHLRWFHADLLDREALESAMQGADAVFHLAARAGVRASLRDPQAYLRANVLGTQAVLSAVSRLGVPHLLNVSSSSVYGARSRGPFSESDPLEVPASPYAASKRAAELLCETWQRLHGFHLTTLRFFTVYGPRQRPDMAIHRFFRAAVEGRPLPLYGDGASARDYTYVDDIVDGLLAALERPGGYRLYNLGRSEPVRLDELVRRIGRVLGRELRVEHLPAPLGDVPLTWADTSRAERELGYRPRVSLDEGLRRFADWFLAQRGAP